MTPKKFPEVNFTYAEDQPEYQPLPVHHAQDQAGTVTSCWELSEEEIEVVKQTGVIYLRMLTFGQPLQPVYLTVDKEELF